MSSHLKWTKFKKKPIIIEAFQITKEFCDKYKMKAVPSYGRLFYVQKDYVIVVTLEGNLIGDIGDWVVKGIKGELYPVKNNIFKATYERSKDTKV